MNYRVQCKEFVSRLTYLTHLSAKGRNAISEKLTVIFAALAKAFVSLLGLKFP